MSRILYLQNRPPGVYRSNLKGTGGCGSRSRGRLIFCFTNCPFVITLKSVSRFARNTVDSLQTVRALKEKGVEIFFEEQNIWTLDSKGELLITILSSLAQEEAHSISENVTWGKRRAFEAGRFFVVKPLYIKHYPNAVLMIHVPMPLS